MRRTYLQTHRTMLWNSLLLSGTLQEHLLETDAAAQSRLELLMPELMKDAGATEALKASDPMRWGRPDERLQGAGRGNHPQGAGVQLSFLEALRPSPGTGKSGERFALRSFHSPGSGGRGTPGGREHGPSPGTDRHCL